MTGRFPILMYHGVGAATLTSVTPNLFQQQMASLHHAGVRVIPLGEAVYRLRRKQPLPPRSLAITFDDGLRSVYDEAWPVLARYGFPATVFLVTQHCGGDNAWPGQPAQVQSEPMLTWAQVHELDRNGMEFGAHTLDHPRLDLLTAQAARTQIAGSKTAIDEQLGHEITLFAYPYGRHTPAVRDLVGECFAGACTARPGLVNGDSDPLLLERIDVTYVAQPLLFAGLFGPIFPPYITTRRILRRVGTRLLSRAWA